MNILQYIVQPFGINLYRHVCIPLSHLNTTAASLCMISTERHMYTLENIRTAV